MSDAVITVILTQVATILEKQIREELSLICGVGHQFKKLRSEFESIRAVLADAEKRQVKEESVKVWLEKLKDVSYDTEDVLSEWITAMQKVKSDGCQSSRSRKVTSLITMPCFGFSRVAFRREIAIKIKKLNERLSDIAAEKVRYNFSEVLSNETLERPKTASYIDDAEVEGRGVDKENLIGRLLGRENRAKGLNVVSLVGLGGVGKTTLAQLVFNSDEVVNHFERAIWVCASDPFDEVRIARAILEFIEGSAPYLFELETLVTKIRNYVEGERFLLVLDDVWTEDFRKWEQLLNSLKTGKAGSTILVTTRKESVARIMGCSDLLRLGGLSVEDSWTLFEKIAFFERKRERFEEVGMKIAEKCKGLPLAIKTIASLVRFKATLKEWEDVLRSEFWELEEAEAEEGLFPPLMLSYYDLPSNVKRCFTFCTFFPKDHAIEASNLVQLWMAHGYLAASTKSFPVEVEAERVGQDYLQILAMRSFFQDVVRDRDRIVSVRMHDVVHDFAHYIAKNECSVVEFNADFQRRMESSHKRARHLTVVRAEGSQFPNVTNVEKLFTLWVQSFYDTPPIISQLDRVDPEFIRRLLSLRALDFSRNRLGELPKEIGLLIKLKHLNLSHNPFWELPETLCDLYNLLTLKLSGCHHLRRLPSKIEKLTNLRHLEIDRTSSLKMLPKGIAELASLQTLNKFIIISVNERNNAACGLVELRRLNNLRGCLKIEGLGFAADAAEAKKAELRNKAHLSDLEMDFSPLIKSDDSQYEVIEALEAPENLDSLQITSYGGTSLPQWIMNLTKLQRIILQDCQNCAVLPPLASLPLLVTLHLEGLNSMKCLDLESLANGGDTPAFPALKKLKISRMERWEEWDVSVGSIAMPRLRCLKISQCGKVKALPALLLRGSMLRKLRIDGCPLLHRLYNKESGELWSEISHISKVRVS